MKLINKEKRYEGAITHIHSTMGEFLHKDTSFTAGIDFAETELQNIAIEFAEWIETLGLDLHTDGAWRDYAEELEYATTIELFTEFITERNNHEQPI